MQPHKLGPRKQPSSLRGEQAVATLTCQEYAGLRLESTFVPWGVDVGGVDVRPGEVFGLK